MMDNITSSTFVLMVARIFAEVYLLVRYWHYMTARTDIEDPRTVAYWRIGSIVALTVLKDFLDQESMTKPLTDMIILAGYIYLAMELHFKVPTERADEMLFFAYSAIILYLMAVTHKARQRTRLQISGMLKK